MICPLERRAKDGKSNPQLVERLSRKHTEQGQMPKPPTELLSEGRKESEARIHEEGGAIDE